MHSEISPFLLEKYLNDNCTAQEKELVENWYASLSGKMDYLDSLSENDQQRLQEETFAYIQAQIHPKESKKAVLSVNFRWLAGIAAALVSGFGIYFLLKSETGSNKNSAQQTSKQSIADTIRFQNNEPKMVMHQLPDSSTVWMHADASITYPRNFAKDQRSITYTGEGFFDISHDKSRPFLIRSGEIMIKVLGTRFNVKAKEKQNIMEVAVVSGSVSVRAPGKDSRLQEIILKPQQKAFFETKSKRLTFIEIPDQAKKEIFEPVTIVFEETPLRTVIRQLEQKFETHIHLTNQEMNNCKVTADFEQQSLPVILEMLCASLEANYTMSENTILIEGSACK